MRVLVTRPAAQADEWVQILRAEGIDAAALPLIDIAAPLDAAPVAQAWATLPTRDCVVFVSPNAVEQFFRRRPAGALWPAAVRAASPGPGTTQALRRAGVPPGLILEPAEDAEQFDSESLWARMQGHDWQHARVLFMRGESGREWLADTLRAAGAQVEHVSAYRRTAPALDACAREQLAAALQAPQRYLWWFSSSEAIDHLAALVGPQAPWHSARALATHPRIAERARQLGFGSVDEASPGRATLLAAIRRSIQSPAP